MQARRIKNFQSLQNSRKLSPLQNRDMSNNKLKRIKQVLRQFNVIQKLKTEAYHPTGSFISSVKNASKPAQLKSIQQFSFKNAQIKIKNSQDLSVKKYSLQNSIKLKNSIRIRTQHQKRNASQSKSLKKKQDLQNSTTQSVKLKKQQVLTQYEKQQAKMYQVLYVGERRIHNDQDFTNIQGYPIIKVGDSIKFRYQILSELGHGAFGYVYKAIDHKYKEKVAIKIIKNHVRYQKQAKVQIKILQQAIISDPNGTANIIKLKSAFLFRGHPCLVFELLYINLYQFCFQLNFIGLSLDLIRRFAIQILHTLNFLQKKRIIHCDIKPENIMIKKENKTGLKVIDFGSGCFDGEQIYNYVQSRYYRAPQIILGVQYGCPIDMWSFGCVCFQLFAGRPMFSGQNQEDQVSLFIETFGMPPLQIINKGLRSSKYFTIQNNQIKTKFQAKKAKSRLPFNKSIQKQLKRCADQQFIKFIKACINWTPEQRLKASEAIVHPWILAGIPQQLKQQHIKSVKI